MPNSRELAEAIFSLSKLSWRQTATATSDLTESEFLSLDFLCDHAPTAVGDITRDVKVMPAQMSRIIRRLESAGYITTGINPQDKRKVDVHITAKGRRAHGQYSDAKLAPLVAAMEKLSAKQQVEFMNLIHAMA